MPSFNWLKAARVVLFPALCLGITLALNYALIPLGPVRINFHNLRNRQGYDTVFVGTSHGQYGIGPGTMDQDGISSVSLCIAGAYPDDMYYLLRLAAEAQNPSQVVYELDPSYWVNKQRSGSTRIFFYQGFPPSAAKFLCFMDKIAGLDFRSTPAPWSYYRNLYAQIPSNIRKKLSPIYRNYDPTILDVPAGHYGRRGFIHRNRVEGEDKGIFNNTPWDENRVREKALRYFDRIAAFCKGRDTELIVITTPIPLDTLPQFEESYQASREYFTDLVERYGLKYYNFSYMNPRLIGRTMEGHRDYDGHVNGIKVREYSTILGRFLVDIKNKEIDPGKYFSYTS